MKRANKKREKKVLPVFGSHIFFRCLFRYLERFSSFLSRFLCFSSLFWLSAALKCSGLWVFVCVVLFCRPWRRKKVTLDTYVCCDFTLRAYGYFCWSFRCSGLCQSFTKNEILMYLWNENTHKQSASSKRNISFIQRNLKFIQRFNKNCTSQHGKNNLNIQVECERYSEILQSTNSATQRIWSIKNCTKLEWHSF